jgi:hypothetical protein
MDLTRPLVLGYYVSDPYAPTLMNTATVAAFAAWCRTEGYELGVPYRNNDGTDGAYDAMFGVLRDREDVAGVIVPTLNHLGLLKAKRLAAIEGEVGKRVFELYPAVP